MHSKNKKIWFPAKRYGWGWGPPNCWQGWVVLAVWIALLLAGMPLVKAHPFFHLGYVVAMILALIAICAAKGERPRWRWGKD